MSLSYEDLAEIFKKKGWTWGTSSSEDHIPTAGEIEESIRSKIKDVCRERCTIAIGSGRLEVRRDSERGDLYVYLEIGHHIR